MLDQKICPNPTFLKYKTACKELFRYKKNILIEVKLILMSSCSHQEKMGEKGEYSILYVYTKLSFER